MLLTRAVEVILWEEVLSPEVLRLPDELARVDALLDDPAFFVPFVPSSTCTWGVCRRRWGPTLGRGCSCAVHSGSPT